MLYTTILKKAFSLRLKYILQSAVLKKWKKICWFDKIP